METKMHALVFLSLFLLVTVNTAGKGTDADECKPTRCKHNGPAIKFPFWLRNRQPPHCGYTGFELSCTTTKKKHTVLELPSSVKLFVKHINYTTQQIQVYDPHSCLPKQLQRLNISASPFQFVVVDESRNSLDSFSFFNCSSGKQGYNSSIFPCLSTHGYQVQAYSDRYTTLLGLLPPPPCRKMYDTAPIPRDIIESMKHDFYLSWSNPMCNKCAAKGLECRLDGNGTESQTRCFYIPNKDKESRKLVITGPILGSFLLVLISIGIYWFHHSNKTEKENQMKIKKFLEDYKALKPTRYTYADLKRITNQFKDRIGQGGYGIVFKGKLSNEVTVAVKLLNNFKGNGDEFINEVRSMGRIHHVNVARLVGFCADGVRRALVYEFLQNGSLDKYIFSADGQRQSRNLGWEKLYDIALGIAKGIDYLHQGCDQRIIHLDIKPHNVLLDKNFNPKMSDFGMAKLYPKEQSSISMTAARGTIGYIAPEVFSRNFRHVSYKSDVYSFGMLLLEIVGGRKNMDVNDENSSQGYFPEWVYNRLNREEDLEMENVDERQSKMIKKLSIVGLWCIQWYPVDRPSMNKVVRMFEGDKDLVMPQNPFASNDSAKRSSTAPSKVRHSSLDIISESD
ncbi:rust resistance kinase Lr10 isoform X2 [Ziziphus jujuba]|uniref:Rust resistance kinase Lr10 isoform X2 n=1 Tax=Ziziphus jujuba TaxID=326968 RepID=A0A6P3ZSJ9_ZIZJJ|nr:rust resistance kinase Lr10 isoform X2 [Ziziphus jujuba]